MKMDNQTIELKTKSNPISISRVFSYYFCNYIHDRYIIDTGSFNVQGMSGVPNFGPLVYDTFKITC